MVSRNKINGGDSDAFNRTNKQIATGASRSSARSKTPRYPLSGSDLSNCKEIILRMLSSSPGNVTSALISKILSAGEPADWLRCGKPRVGFKKHFDSLVVLCSPKVFPACCFGGLTELDYRTGQVT
jgi:hypothetical protein